MASALRESRGDRNRSGSAALTTDQRSTPAALTTAFAYTLATPDDDEAIRRLLARNPMPGSVLLTYEREPDYFAGCSVLGSFWQVLVAREAESGEIAGLASRAVRSLYVNGRVESVGYLSQLRVDPRFRGRWLVSNGFRMLRELDGDGRVSGYLATITEGNREALGVLVSRRRAHFPEHHELARLCTLAIRVTRSPLAKHDPSVDVRWARPEDVPDVVAFLDRHGPERQFFPAYREEDFLGGALARGFEARDFAVARRSGEVVGVVGLWDQSAFKQTVVRGYSGMLGRVRPLYNAVARLRGRPELPPPGVALRSTYASFVRVAGDDAGVFRALLRLVHARAAVRRRSYLTLGLTTADPLYAEARRYDHVPYFSRLYAVGWDGGKLVERLDDRVPYVEIAAL